MVLFTTLRLSYGAIEKDDVLMAFILAAGGSKIGQVANGVLKNVSGYGHHGEFRQEPK